LANAFGVSLSTESWSDGTSNDDTYQSNLPWVQVTEGGKTCLENGECVPYDAGLFLSRIRSQIPNLDPIVDLYLKEALNSFRSGAYLAVAVMTGVAAERNRIARCDCRFNHRRPWEKKTD
jgi:hypothetical protein